MIAYTEKPKVGQETKKEERRLCDYLPNNITRQFRDGGDVIHNEAFIRQTDNEISLRRLSMGKKTCVKSITQVSYVLPLLKNVKDSNLLVTVLINHLISLLRNT